MLVYYFDFCGNLKDFYKVVLDIALKELLGISYYFTFTIYFGYCFNYYSNYNNEYNIYII